jgi:hypothetical protein
MRRRREAAYRSGTGPDPPHVAQILRGVEVDRARLQQFGDLQTRALAPIHQAHLM